MKAVKYLYKYIYIYIYIYKLWKSCCLYCTRWWGQYHWWNKAISRCVSPQKAIWSVITVSRSTWMTTKLKWSRYRSFLYRCDRPSGTRVLKLWTEIPNLKINWLVCMNDLEILSSGVHLHVRKDWHLHDANKLSLVSDFLFLLFSMNFDKQTR